MELNDKQLISLLGLGNLYYLEQRTLTSSLKLKTPPMTMTNDIGCIKSDYHGLPPCGLALVALSAVVAEELQFPLPLIHLVLYKVSKGMGGPNNCAARIDGASQGYSSQCPVSQRCTRGLCCTGMWMSPFLFVGVLPHPPPGHCSSKSKLVPHVPEWCTFSGKLSS